MNPRPFNIGIVGTGIMGRRMLAALQAHPRFRATTLWDANPQAAREAAAAAPDARIADDLDDLVHCAKVDAVYVASPPAGHRAAVEAIAAAGRACFCEKPLAADVAEATALRDRVVASGLPFAINFPFARAPASRRLVELVRDGRLGIVGHATIRLRFAAWPRPWQVGAASWLAGSAEGGFTREVLSHFVFLAERLFGPATVADVHMTRAAGQAETALRATLVHATTTVEIDAAVAGDIADDNRFEVVGCRETATLINWGSLAYRGQISDRVDATAATLDGLASLLEGRTDHGLAGIDEGVSVVRVIEALQHG
jgi:predicted dehydrogenase